MALGPNFGNVVGGESSGKGGGGTTSYFPARVKEVVTSDSTDPKSLFVQNGGWASLGFISFLLRSLVNAKESLKKTNK